MCRWGRDAGSSAATRVVLGRLWLGPCCPAAGNASGHMQPTTTAAYCASRLSARPWPCLRPALHHKMGIARCCCCCGHCCDDVLGTGVGMVYRAVRWPGGETKERTDKPPGTYPAGEVCSTAQVNKPCYDNHNLKSRSCCKVHAPSAIALQHLVHARTIGKQNRRPS